MTVIPTASFVSSLVVPSAYPQPTPFGDARNHESLGNLTPADADFGRAADILRQRATIKRQTIEHRRLQHRKIAA